MRVVDGAGQFHFENLIKGFNCLCCGFLVHESSFLFPMILTQKHISTKTRGQGVSPSGALGAAPLSACLCVSVFSVPVYCAFEVTVFPIGEWSGIAETPSS